MADLIKKTDNLNAGREKLNAAITDAETAKVVSGQADDKATEALAQSESTQTQLDTIVINGDSSVEAAQARVDAEGTAYGTLKQRLDAEYSEVTSQLAEKATLEELKRSLGHIPFGVLKMEEGFAPLLCTFVRKSDGRIYHNFNFDKYKTGTELYVSPISGSDSTGDGTEAKPYQSIFKTVESIATRTGTNFVIKCLDVRFNRGMGIRNRTIDGKRISIVPDNDDNEIIMSNHWEGLSWIQDGTGTWKATRSGVYSVFDLRKKDAFGVPLPLTNKATISECQSEKGSWFTDNTNIWIHTWDGLIPNDDDWIVNVSDYVFEPTITNNGVVYVENAMFLHGGNLETMTISGGVEGLPTNDLIDISFIANNCMFVGGDLRVNRSNAVNAVSFKKIPKVYLFDCIAAHGGEDGFNYHYTGIHANNRRKCVVVEYNCVSYGHGIHSNTETSNSSTAHGGICVLRMNGIYYESKGPVVNDANGCLSVYYDCNAQDSKSIYDYQRSAFRSDNDGADVKGKMKLVNCNGGGKDTYSIYTGDDMEIVVQAFRGTNIPQGLNMSIVS